MALRVSRGRFAIATCGVVGANSAPTRGPAQTRNLQADAAALPSNIDLGVDKFWNKIRERS